MSFSKICSFAVDELTNKLRQFFLIVILMSLSMILVGISLYLYNSTSAFEKISDESLSHGNEGTYCLATSMTAKEGRDIEGFDTDMFQKIRRMEGVENAGCFKFYMMENIKGDNNVIDILNKSTYNIDNKISAMYVTYEALGMLNISLEDGKEFEKPENEDIQYMYLGYNQKDIPVGTELTWTIMDWDDNIKKAITKDIKIIVKGYIKKGCKVVNDRILYRNEMLTDNYYEMDNLPLIVFNDDYLITPADLELTFNISNKADKKEVMENINKIAEKNGLTFMYTNFKDAFSSRERTKMKIYSYIIQLAVVIVVTVVILQISMQSISVITNSGKYGIMYANGITKKDLRKIIILQSVIKYLVAFLLTVTLTYIGYKVVDCILFEDAKDYALNYFLYCIKHFVLFQTLIISVVVMAIGTAVPLYIINKMQPVELIKSGQ